MFGAQLAGAKYFLAPKDNCRDLVGHIPAGLQVFKITSFKDALTAVEKIGKNENLSSLPRCTTN
jgi:PDZ domain-containing protein